MSNPFVLLRSNDHFNRRGGELSSNEFKRLCSITKLSEPEDFAKDVAEANRTFCLSPYKPGQLAVCGESNRIDVIDQKTGELLKTISLREQVVEGAYPITAFNQEFVETKTHGIVSVAFGGGNDNIWLVDDKGCELLSRAPAWASTVDPGFKLYYNISRNVCRHGSNIYFLAKNSLEVCWLNVDDWLRLKQEYSFQNTGIKDVMVFTVFRKRVIAGTRTGQIVQSGSSTKWTCEPFEGLNIMLSAILANDQIIIVNQYRDKNPQNTLLVFQKNLRLQTSLVVNLSRGNDFAYMIKILKFIEARRGSFVVAMIEHAGVCLFGLNGYKLIQVAVNMFANSWLNALAVLEKGAFLITNWDTTSKKFRILN